MASWAARFAPTAVALFLTTAAAVPRAVVIRHHHAGGERAHVHPWGEDVVAPHDDDEHPHHHRPSADAHSLALEARDGDHLDHLHQQPPFQPATRSRIVQLVHATIADSVETPRPRLAGRILALPTPARAPPLSRRSLIEDEPF